MIARSRLGHDAARPLDYLPSEKVSDLGASAQSRMTAVTSFGLGLQEVEVDWIDTSEPAKQVLETASIAIRTLAGCRPDLKHRVAHIVLSVDPRWAQGRAKTQIRHAYRETLTRILEEVGLQDRCGVGVLHADGHSTWRARNSAAGPIEHLHGVFALPHPDTLRSISAHRFRKRVSDVCREAWLQRSDALSPRREETRAPNPSLVAELDLDEALRAISRQERARKRQRERGSER